MTNEARGDHEKLKEVLDKTLHRFKNNLQTQLSLMNIQTATNRSYFDDKHVLVDRMFALTHVYDLYYVSNKEEDLPVDSKVSLQSFLYQFLQYLKNSSPKIEFDFNDISEIKIEVDDLLILSYVIIEINDFRKSLDDDLLFEVSHKNKKVDLRFSFSSLGDHQKFEELFESQFKILDLMVMQLKGKMDYMSNYLKLTFPIL